MNVLKKLILPAAAINFMFLSCSAESQEIWIKCKAGSTGFFEGGQLKQVGKDQDVRFYSISGLTVTINEETGTEMRTNLHESGDMIYISFLGGRGEADINRVTGEYNVKIITGGSPDEFMFGSGSCSESERPRQRRKKF